jgi:GNAT superfamily N-acetyltransferase
MVEQATVATEISIRHELRAGDLGWIVESQSKAYADEHGWDTSYETLVLGIVAAFAAQHDPTRERCWIAERDGQRLGSVMLVRQTDEVAKLRLLLVMPEARGSGLGTRLVRTCLDFARACGYTTVTLWTNDILLEARRIYERKGFQIVHSEAHHSFGHDLVGETWELRL